jgi:hypothetical protein
LYIKTGIHPITIITHRTSTENIDSKKPMLPVIQHITTFRRYVTIIISKYFISVLI